MFKKFEKMNLKKKLQTGYLIVIFLMVISGIISVAGSAALDGGFNDFVNGSNTADSAVKKCRIDINIAARCIREAVLNEDSGSLADYRAKVDEKMAELGEELQLLEETGLIEDAIYQEYENTIMAWGEAAYKILNMIEAGDRQGAVNAILNECVPTLDKVIEMSLAIDESTDEMMNASVTRSQIIFWASMVLVIVFILIAVVLSLRIAKRIIESITKPLAAIAEVAGELMDGNLHSTIDYRSDDEIGKLAHDLRKAIRILSSYVDDIAIAMDEFSKGNFIVQPNVEWKGDFIGILDAFMTFERSMAETVTGIQQVANQVKNAAEEVSASSMDLAGGATEQASITEELAATIETISEQVAVNAENAKEISRKVEGNNAEIINGNEKMQEMLQSMEEINKASQEISKIINTINDIAAQTNLLALNASIEAARAGDAGKGFAVVADQVSLLASQSAGAAKESTTLIETSIRAVEKGFVIADETARQLENVLAESKKITQQVNGVAEALEAQNDAFEQINAGVEHINDVVQTNSASSEECAASSQEMHSQAITLEGLVSGFKVGNLESKNK